MPRTFGERVLVAIGDRLSMHYYSEWQDTETEESRIAYLALDSLTKEEKDQIEKILCRTQERIS